MPGPSDSSQRNAWRGLGDAWTMVADLLTATAVWGAIGFGLDSWFGTWPILFVIGALAGHAAGIYILWRKTKQMEARLRRGEGRDDQR